MQAIQGGALYLTQGKEALFQNATFIDNHAEELGGSITVTSYDSVVGTGLNCRNNSVSLPPNCAMREDGVMMLLLGGRARCRSIFSDPGHTI
jgi:predicted outer membrane repeat protein